MAGWPQTILPENDHKDPTVLHLVLFAEARPVLALTYLLSYEGMGVCSLRCLAGCSCTSLTLDALSRPAVETIGAAARDVSITETAQLELHGRSTKCVVELRNVAGATDAAHRRGTKWKLLGARLGWVVKNAASANKTGRAQAAHEPSCLHRSQLPAYGAVNASYS